MTSFASIIVALGGPVIVAPEIGAKEEAVRKMRFRDSINSKHWPALVSLARKKRVSGITHETMAQLAAARAAKKKRAA